MQRRSEAVSYWIAPRFDQEIEVDFQPLISMFSKWRKFGNKSVIAITLIMGLKGINAP